MTISARQTLQSIADLHPFSIENVSHAVHLLSVIHNTSECRSHISVRIIVRSCVMSSLCKLALYFRMLGDTDILSYFMN